MLARFARTGFGVGTIVALALAAGAPALLWPREAGAQDRDDRFFILRDPFRQRSPTYQPNTRWSPPSLIEVPQRSRSADVPGESQGVTFATSMEADAKRDSPATEYIAVIGDSLSDHLAIGLADAFAQDRPDIAVLKKGRAGSTLSRGDQPTDWLTLAFDILAAEKVTIAVIMVGINDRQPVRDETGMHEPRSDRWRELYARRVDELIARFKQKNVPVYWVGLPAMRGPRLSQDMQYLNDIVRERVTRAEATYVDVWDGFVDESGAFVLTGPALDGQNRRLRAQDGVHFTRAGGRKLAHFVEREIRTLLGRKAPLIPALPSEEPAPEAPVVGQPKPRPLAGPVLPLTGSLGPGGGLAGAPATRAGAAPGEPAVIRTLMRGEPPAPVPGRADDFSWRPGTQDAGAAPVATSAPESSQPTQARPQR